MRASKALLLPFCCGGYDIDIVREHIALLEAGLASCGVDVETAAAIRSMAEAEAASRQYNPFCYDLAVLIPVTWSEPRLAAVAARQFFGSPLAVWCVNAFSYGGRQTEMSSAPAAAALKGCLQEMGVKCEFFAGLEFSERQRARFQALACTARTISLLRNAKLGFFGQNFNGITAADLDLSLLRRRLGTEVYTFDCSELIRRMERFDAASGEYAAMCRRVTEKLSGSAGPYLDRIVRMCMALEDYVSEYDLSGLDIRCHTELSQTYGLSACLPLSVLGDRLPCSCEADIPVMLTQMMLHDLSGGSVTTYADLRTFYEDGIDAGACGYAPCGLTGGTAAVGGAEAPGNACSPGYLTNRAGLKEGRLTMARLLKFSDGTLKLHLIGANAAAVTPPLQEMGCPYYPMAKLTPDVPVEQFMRYVGANHYALVYEDILDAARMFCRYTQIELL